jgi:hypothetical protein
MVPRHTNEGLYMVASAVLIVATVCDSTRARDESRVENGLRQDSAFSLSVAELYDAFANPTKTSAFYYLGSDDSYDYVKFSSRLRPEDNRFYRCLRGVLTLHRFEIRAKRPRVIGKEVFPESVRRRRGSVEESASDGE